MLSEVTATERDLEAVLVVGVASARVAARAEATALEDLGLVGVGVKALAVAAGVAQGTAAALAVTPVRRAATGLAP